MEMRYFYMKIQIEKNHGGEKFTISYRFTEITDMYWYISRVKIG